MRNSKLASQIVQHALGSLGAVTLPAAYFHPSLLLMGEFEVVFGGGNCWSKIYPKKKCWWKNQLSTAYIRF